MPKQPNIIQFSVPQDILERLEQEITETEKSVSLVAKRYFLSVFQDKTDTNDSILKDLVERIDHLEKGFDLAIPDENIDQDIAKLNEEVSRLNDWLKQLDQMVKDDQRLTQLEEAIEDIRTSLEIIEGQVKATPMAGNLVKATVKPPPPPKRGRRTSKG